MKTAKLTFLSLYVLLLVTNVSADLRLPAVISDNMVLQEQRAVPIWGWAEPGESVTVTGSWENSSVSAKADPEGKWQVKLQTPKASGPYTLTVQGNNTLVLDNILIGEVWECSGQ